MANPPLQRDVKSPMKTALLVIDLQNDFTRDDGKVPACTSQMSDVINTINAAIHQRSRDGELSAVVTTRWSNPMVKLLTKNSVKPGSFGAEIDARLSQDIHPRFIKSSKDIFTSQKLTQWLKENQVEEVIFSGLALEHCISVSVKAAVSRHYRASLLAGGLASYQCANREKYLLKLQQSGARVHREHKVEQVQ